MPAVGHDVLIQVYASTVSAADHRACALDVPAGVWLLRRTGHPRATTPGPYRAEDLAYLVELADIGRKHGNVVVRIPPTHPEGHRS